MDGCEKESKEVNTAFCGEEEALLSLLPSLPTIDYSTPHSLGPCHGSASNGRSPRFGGLDLILSLT